MFTLYVPLYESDLRTVKSELATFFEAFPYATIWANTVDGQGYDMVFMGHLDQPKIDIDAAEAAAAAVPSSRRSWSRCGRSACRPSMDLFSTYTGQRADLGPWVAGRGDQSRSRPAAAISGRLGDQLEPGGCDLSARCCGIGGCRTIPSWAPGAGAEAAGYIAGAH